MSKKYMLDVDHLASFTSNVKLVLDKKSVFVSILICLVGLGIIFLSTWMEDKSSSSYMAGNTLAVVLLIFGFYRLMNKRNLLIYVPTGSAMLCGSFYLDTQQLERFKAALTEGPKAEFTQFNLTKSGNTRLDYVVARDGKFVAAQLYQYIPYNFEPATDVICYEVDDAQNLAMFLLKNHGKI